VSQVSKGKKIKAVLGLLIVLAILAAAVPVCPEPMPMPSVSINLAGKGDQTSTILQLIILLTVLSLAPAILIMLTSFTRIVVVLSMLRHALGTQGMPPNQIIIGLALFLTFFIMAPVWDKVNTLAVQPYLSKQITTDKAFELASPPLKDFMLKQTREKDIALFLDISKAKRPEKAADLGLAVLVPAFVISELRTAFQIGFLVYLPFLVLDMVVASVLLSMGMMMLPPIMVSLPFKLLLFVMVDGWNLIVGSLVRSFG